MDGEVLYMDFFHVMYFISQDSLMASAERNRGEKKTGPALHKKPGKEERRRPSAMNCSQGGERCGRSTFLRLEEEEEGDQRSESTKLVSLCGRWVCCFFNCPSSPHPPSLVPPRLERSIGRNVLALFTAGGAGGFAFPETKDTRQGGVLRVSGGK